MNNFKAENIFSLMLRTIFIFEIIRNFYKKIDENIRENKIGSPCISYDLKLKSLHNNRELLVSLTNYGEKQRLSIYIYNLMNEQSSTLDLSRFLKDECQDEKAYNLMEFQASSIEEIEEKLILFFQTLDTSQFEQIAKILKGETWFEMPFDWHGYK